MLENLNRHIIIIFDFSESFRRNFQTQVFPLPKSYFRQIAQFSLISASTRCTCKDQSQLIFSERKFWSIISRYKFSFFFISQTAFVFSGVFMPLFRFSSDQRFWSDVHLIKNCQIAKVFKKLFIISISFLFLISSTNNFIYVFCLWFL